MPRPKLRTPAFREDVLMAATAALEDVGPGAFTARSVASVSGTSVAALYEMFGDKAGLVRSIFLHGFGSLADFLVGVPTTDDPRADLVAMLDAVRDFGVASPMLFDVMFSRPFAEFEPTAGDVASAGEIYKLIVGRVRQWSNSAGLDVDPIDAAHVLVAVNRGLIASELSGVLGRATVNVARRRRLGLEAAMTGIEHLAITGSQ